MYANTFDWTGLPLEMKLAVLDNLSLRDVWSCSRANRNSYAVCLPILFKTVDLPSIETLSNFLEAVPSHHYPLIHDLSVTTRSRYSDYHEYDAFTRPAPPKADDGIASLLSYCTSLESLSITVCGTLSAEVILPVFKGLDRVKKLKLENLEQEDIESFSERLVVALAFSLPRLEDLSLTRITRSALHAPELHCSNVPIAQGDENIPAQPILGHELRLPQLFRLSHLKRLKIRDTHLGDPLWAGPALDEESEACCPLEVLDLGSCAHISPAANELHTARILARVPASITSCALSSSLPPATPIDGPPSPLTKCSSPLLSRSSPFSPVTETCIPPLLRLRTLHLTPLVPTSSLGSTLSQPALAGSPVHTLSCSFHPDDAAEGCAALEEFLRERARCTLPLAERNGKAHGRKRAGSKLGQCTTFNSLNEDTPATSSTSQSTARARANTTIVTTVTSSEPPSLTPLYPSLVTLAVEIPAESESAIKSPGGKLSPRRLAAAKRRAEERRNAAYRLQTLAKELGLEVIVRGIDFEINESSGSSGLPARVTNEPGMARARANSA